MMRGLFALSLMAGLQAAPALAVQVQCTDHSTTFIYKQADLAILGGVLRDGGVGNNVTGGFDSGCLFRLREPAMLSAAGTVRIEVVQTVSWQGVVEPTSADKGPNRILFNLEAEIGTDLETAHYRLGDMNQDVHWTDAQGRYGLDAFSKAVPFVTADYRPSAAVDKIDVLLCELQGGVDIVVKEVDIATDLYEPELCAPR